MRMKKFNQWYPINEEAAPRIPVSEDYWLKKGKSGKRVALYTHDDMDGIFSAIEVKKYLLNKGFTIEKYGILNYSDGWKYTTLDPSLINIVVDFANMPGDERDEYVDFYLDHHGLFSEEELERYKKSPVQKKKTASAYEAVCQSLGVPQDDLTLSVIDMIDAAKYQDYGVSWQRLLDFNLSDIKKSDNKRLEFAAAFNQFLKRADHQTLISVIHNCKDASIYSIFNTMKAVYGEHNVYPSGPLAGKSKDFMSDSQWRLSQMQQKTRGKSGGSKKTYLSQQDFIKDFQRGTSLRLDGYQIIGNLAFIPTGTWANALRARTIVEADFNNGVISKEPDFILLQYGGTLQVCSYKKMSEIENLPILKNGKVVDDLGAYMTSILKNFQQHFNYYDPDTSIGQDEITVSGGHGGIGSISNIFGTCDVDPYKGVRFIDMFKNKIISDLSGVRFNISMSWGDPSEGKQKENPQDYKVMSTSDVTKLDPYGKVIKDTNENYEYHLVDKSSGKPSKVTRDEFIKAGSTKGMKTDRKSLMTIDNQNKRVIAKFESFKSNK
jgi:hypothetical protein